MPNQEKRKLVDNSGTTKRYHAPQDPPRVMRRGTNYMSTSAFQTMVEEIERQRAQTRFSRSASVGPDMQPSLLNPLLTGGRRALYGTLPFVAAFGMQHRESTIKRVLSVASSSTLHTLQESEVRRILYYVDMKAAKSAPILY